MSAAIQDHESKQELRPSVWVRRDGGRVCAAHTETIAEKKKGPKAPSREREKS